MLTKKDKEWIVNAIREEFKRALFREITLKKKARGPGEVDGRVETATGNLLDELVRSIPYWEQVVNGVAAASEKSNNRSIEMLEKVNVLGEFFVSLEKPLMTIAKFSEAIESIGLLEQLEKVTSIEYKPNETDTG